MNKNDKISKNTFKELPKAKQKSIILGLIVPLLMLAYGIYSLVQSNYTYGFIFITISIFSLIWMPITAKKEYNKTRNEIVDEIVQEKIDIDSMAEEKKQHDIEEQVKKEWDERERRMRCNVCGNIFCYTKSDIKDNQREAGLAVLSSIGSVASAIGGTKYDMYEQSKASSKHSARIKDFSRCPKCNSTDIVEIGPNGNYNTANNFSQPTPQASTADELKKYKELLDLGAITQEEFDIKKKDLLGL